MGKQSVLQNLASFLILSLFALGSAPGFADDLVGPTGTIEVVQSVPLETTLTVPGLRQAQDVWLEMIAAAQTSIDLEQFYVSDEAGQALQPVLQAIQSAAARGVHVRLLVDAGYYKTYPDSVDQINQTANSEARTIDFSSLGGVQHSKYFVVDGKQAFVGSQNFDWRALNQIHEVGLRIADAKVNSDLQMIFEKDWAQGTGVGAQATKTYFTELPDLMAALVPSLSSSSLSFFVVASPASVNPAGIPDTLSSVTALIGKAQQTLSIQVMQYTTSLYQSSAKWHVLDAAVRAAAARGVHVQLLVDVSSLKTGKADLQSLAKLANVEVRTVTIPQYSGGAIPYARLIHSKYLTIDGQSSWVGSENWEGSYFTGTRNVGLVVQNATVAAQLGQIFNQVWSSAYAAGL
jgi:phosphatidylserine/phosphatidylglycerophosphate/cardiolipin synthase-like enzyme